MSPAVWLRLPRPPMFDALIAVALCVCGQAAIWSGGTDEGPHSVTVWTGLLITLPLAWRRAAPEFAVTVFTIGALAQSLLADRIASIWALAAVLLISFSLGEASSGRRRAVAAVGMVAGLWIAILLQTDAPLGDKAFTAPLLAGGPFLVGLALRRQQLRTERMARLAVRLELEQEEAARQAVAAERSRIARELHDVVAHAVSVMIVQAGAAEQLMETRPDRAASALTSVRQTGKQAVAELHRMLGMMRIAPDIGADLAPQPGVSDIPELVQSLSEVGPHVRLEISGELGRVPPGLGLSAYRIVQEALTNVRKHAGADAETAVAVCVRRDVLSIDVCNTGGSVTGDADQEPSGHGLIGMRERVAMFGGALSAGPEDQMWTVRASIPIPLTESRETA